MGRTGAILKWRVSLVVIVASLTASSLSVAAERRQEVELSSRYDRLDSGLKDWQAQRLEVQSSLAGHTTWYGAVLSERRYGLRNQGLELGAAIPLDDDWVFQPEAGRGFDADFLADWYADLRLQRRLSDGFVASASVRHTEYAASRVERLALGVERYWGNWRASYTLNVSDVEGAGTPVGHALAMDYYYGERNVVGLRGILGREEEVLPGGEVIASDVSAIAVRGRHWFHPAWALSWELGALSQGDLYDRQAVQIGLRHAF